MKTLVTKSGLLFFLFCLISGVMAFLAYGVAGWGWLMWIAWIPLIAALYWFPKKWVVGWFGLLLALEVSVGGYLVLLAIESWMLYFAFAFPVILALVFSVVWWFSRRAPFGLRLFLLASFVAMVDFLLALTPITAVISPAITQSGLPFLLSPASLFGFPFVTFLIFLVNGLAGLSLLRFRAGKRVSLLPVGISLGLLFLALLTPIFFRGMPQGTVLAGALDAGMIDGGVHHVTGRLDTERRKLASVEGLYADLTWQAAQKGAEIIIWSEKFLTEDPLASDSLKEDLEVFARDAGAVLVVTYQSEQGHNIAVPVFPETGFGEGYKKHNIAAVLGEDLESGSEYPVYETSGIPFGVLICYDMHFEENSRALADAGANLILVTSNAGSAVNSAGWIARTAAIRAVENQVSLVVATDIGAYFVSPSGKILQQSDGTMPLVLTQEVGAGVGRTVYNAYGGHAFRWLLIPLSLGLFTFSLLPEGRKKTTDQAFGEPQTKPGVPF
jgi:apolipoprotein N-acyltransferase